MFKVKARKFTNFQITSTGGSMGSKARRLAAVLLLVVLLLGDPLGNAEAKRIPPCPGSHPDMSLAMPPATTNYSATSVDSSAPSAVSPMHIPALNGTSLM